MDFPRRFIRLVTGPKLYSSVKAYHPGYTPNTIEIACDLYFGALSIMRKVLYVSWPVVLVTIWQSNFYPILKLVFYHHSVNFIIVTLMMFTFRGFGRILNSNYTDFCDMYYAGITDKKTRTKLLANYDFQMSGLPAGYVALESDSNKPYNGIVDVFLFNVIHPILISIAYPGSVMNNFIGKLLNDGRTKLLRRFHARREWLKVGSNYVDVMFIDRRANGVSNLLIISEGNGAFYENGSFQAMSSLSNYNMLGWNRPQYGESCGRICVEAEQDSAKAVIHYALSELGFSANDITLYGWSIGGFSTLVMAEKVQVKRIILDATFDNVVPLANVAIPIYEPLISWLTRRLVNLDNSVRICGYNGEIKIIRRMEDEIISTVPGVINYNRGNYLLLDLLKYRYPSIINQRTQQFILNYITLEETLQHDIEKQLPSPTELCAIIQNSFSNTSWPLDISVKSYAQSDLNAAAIVLTRMYLFDIVATHCESIDPRTLLHDGLCCKFLDLTLRKNSSVWKTEPYQKSSSRTMCMQLKYSNTPGNQIEITSPKTDDLKSLGYFHISMYHFIEHVKTIARHYLLLKFDHPEKAKRHAFIVNYHTGLHKLSKYVKMAIQELPPELVESGKFTPCNRLRCMCCKAMLSANEIDNDRDQIQYKGRECRIQCVEKSDRCLQVLQNNIRNDHRCNRQERVGLTYSKLRKELGMRWIGQLMTDHPHQENTEHYYSFEERLQPACNGVEFFRYCPF
ncbi:hypothetical protein GJ496_010096 [Pomphorhynchus laevis]|nr:hypothetical protein GJ496_010096 [Pomphorhynchus laevis]